MFTILLVLATASVTLLIAQEVHYSPKARIKKLQKEIFEFAREIGKHNSGDSLVDSSINDPYEKAISKRKKMINALLDYYFDPEERGEYIKERRQE